MTRVMSKAATKPSSTPLVMDADLVMAMVATFSRLDYALKRCALAKGSTERVGPDWKKFARRLAKRQALYKTDAAASALGYFMNHTPEIQILSDGTLGWRRQPRGGDEDVTSFVVRCVRTIRNNLFHRGKSPHDAVDE